VGAERKAGELVGSPAHLQGRSGSVCLLGYDVARTGRSIAEAQRRRVQTVALILDNGSTHAPKQLPLWVKELATRSGGKLTMQLYWLPTNASWLDQIEIWFSLLQRKLLQPKHFTSLNELEQAIADFIGYYNQTAKPLKWSYTVEQLEHKLAPHLLQDVKSAAA
jgi:transposase